MSKHPLLLLGPICSFTLGTTNPLTERGSTTVSQEHTAQPGPCPTPRLDEDRLVTGPG